MSSLFQSFKNGGSLARRLPLDNPRQEKLETAAQREFTVQSSWRAGEHRDADGPATAQLGQQEADPPTNYALLLNARV